ncbi:MAG: 4-alpha-glucanotransferase [Planctomycetales bacterium]|nr:4-alpha-glucanotransferase [Planctomycetales bacterium]
MQFNRSAGILLHITSLPGRFGIGDLGPSAFEFVEFLQAAKQRIWQLLPLGPTTIGNSPYSSYSAFAGNPILISPERLVERGFLTQEEVLECEKRCTENSGQADYEFANCVKWPALRRAMDKFRQCGGCRHVDDYEAFVTSQRWWLDDFALFSALQAHFGTADWTTWDSDLAQRNKDAINNWKNKLANEIEFAQFVQFLFFSQWNELKRFANSKGVQLFGDMPIFVGHGSADVWANQADFLLNRNGRPTSVAGVPPDYFSKTGQLWGNPLYCWEAISANNYRWWIQRFRMAFQTYDLLRIDHFRGFESYWAVPGDAKTAVSGRWEPGPGAALFRRAEAELGPLPIIAEDLGLITDEVHHLREELGFPGMRVLQFGFDSQSDLYHRPESYPENSAAYTGTHDNETIIGWYNNRRDRAETDPLTSYLPIDDSPVEQKLIQLVLDSASLTAIIPMQDYLGLDNSARMNIPGLAEGNWTWQLDNHQLTQQTAHGIAKQTIQAGRC